MSARSGWCTAPPGIEPTHDCRYAACGCECHHEKREASDGA